MSSEDTARRASCACGQLAVKARGEPVRISMCHCLECQKRTGSAFGVQARFPESAVTVTGESSEYLRVADSGNEITFHFCPQCGSTVYYRLHGYPGMVSVPVGGFADPSFPGPRLSIYEERRHAWVEVPAGIERQEEMK